VTPPAISFELLDERWLSDVAALVADPEVRRFTRIPEPPPDGFSERWIARYVEARGHEDGEREGFVALDDGGRFVGLGLAPDIDRDAGEVELGYIVPASARGRGIATAILDLLTSWAFSELLAERAYLIIDVQNHASRRVAERGGYLYEGVMRSVLLKQDRRIDAELWSRLPSDPPLSARASAS
jgi:RimJ/RimL family protein N-acetyltransferase